MLHDLHLQSPPASLYQVNYGALEKRSSELSGKTLPWTMKYEVHARCIYLCEETASMFLSSSLGSYRSSPNATCYHEDAFFEFCKLHKEPKQANISTDA